MKYRPLGSSGLVVSEIGFGAWGIGGPTPGATSYGKTDDNVSTEALLRAQSSGINFYDTSNVYGNGHSETLIGKAFASCRDQVVIATKAGFVDYNLPHDFSPGNIERSVVGSLNRLGTDRIDLLQLHNPTAVALSLLPQTLELLERLKREGRVSAIGVSVKSPEDALPLLALYPFEVVQANFNMMDIRVFQCGLLDALLERNVGFIARTPLGFGFLTGAYDGEETFPADDHRSRWSREQLRLWAKSARNLYRICNESQSTSPASLALRYCLSYPGISTTIPGILSSDEVDMNVKAAEEGALSNASCRKVEAIHAQQSFVVAG